MSNIDPFVEKWVGHLNSADRDMCLVAAKKLARGDDPIAVQALIDALQGRPDDVRMAAVRSLGTIGNKAATRPLVRLLTDSNPTVASAAADALGAIGDSVAVPDLVKILKKYRDGSRHFQLHGFNRGLFMAAMDALKRINTPEARRAVQQYNS